MQEKIYVCPQCGALLKPHFFENKFFSSVYLFFQCNACGFNGEDALEFGSVEEALKKQEAIQNQKKK